MTDPITLPAKADQSYRFHRPTKRNDYIPVPLRWYQVLALHLAGKTPNEIMQETGYSSAMYYKILNHPSIQSVRQQLLDQTQKEFEALFNKVVENIRTQLDDPEPMVRLAAQNQWFKANGKFQPKSDEKEKNLTAEEVVAKLLNINVQVNVAK